MVRRASDPIRLVIVAPVQSLATPRTFHNSSHSLTTGTPSAHVGRNRPLFTIETAAFCVDRKRASSTTALDPDGRVAPTSHTDESRAGRRRTLGRRRLVGPGARGRAGASAAPRVGGQRELTSDPPSPLRPPPLPDRPAPVPTPNPRWLRCSPEPDESWFRFRAISVTEQRRPNLAAPSAAARRPVQ